jgi:hypothetical protein
MFSDAGGAVVRQSARPSTACVDTEADQSSSRTEISMNRLRRTASRLHVPSTGVRNVSCEPSSSIKPANSELKTLPYSAEMWALNASSSR